MIQVFDELNSIQYLQSLWDEKSCLPPKLRSKPETTLESIRRIGTATETYFRQLLNAQSLSRDADQAIIARNLMGMTHFHGIFLAREIDLFSNSFISISTDQLYGSTFTPTVSGLLRRLDPNGTLVKMMLPIVAFSSSCTVSVYSDKKNVAMKLSGSRQLTCIQDKFATILWKIFDLSICL